jgi:hypothetical protein
MIKDFEMNVYGNEVTIIVTSSNDVEAKKDVILGLINPTDPERAWENHRDDMIVCIKTQSAESERVVFNIFVDSNKVDLSESTNVEYLKFKISNDLATIFLQDYCMEEGMDKDLKLSELNDLPAEDGATLGDVRVALQMAIFRELSKLQQE